MSLGQMEGLGRVQKVDAWRGHGSYENQRGAGYDREFAGRVLKNKYRTYYYGDRSAEILLR